MTQHNATRHPPTLPASRSRVAFHPTSTPPHLDPNKPNQQGGLIQKFLASGWWSPLNTLSFCVYLVHYTVLTYYISQVRLCWA